MLTQFLEALLVSSIGTMIIVTLYRVRTRYKRKVKLYGPFAYKLDDSGVLKEISADSVPIGVAETLQRRIMSEVKLPELIMLKGPPLVLFALAIFLIHLIILLLI